MWPKEMQPEAAWGLFAESKLKTVNNTSPLPLLHHHASYCLDYYSCIYTGHLTPTSPTTAC